MYRCDICGRELATPQGLRGHKTFLHGLTKDKITSGTSSLEATQQPPLNYQRIQGLEGVVAELVEELGDYRRRLESVESKAGKVPEHSHNTRHSHSELTELVNAFERMPSKHGYEAITLYGGLGNLIDTLQACCKFMADYGDILRRLKAAVEQQEAKQRGLTCTAYDNICSLNICSLNKWNKESKLP